MTVHEPWAGYTGYTPWVFLRNAAAIIGVETGVAAVLYAVGYELIG